MRRAKPWLKLLLAAPLAGVLLGLPAFRLSRGAWDAYEFALLAAGFCLGAWRYDRTRSMFDGLLCLVAFEIALLARWVHARQAGLGGEDAVRAGMVIAAGVWLYPFLPRRAVRRAAWGPKPRLPWSAALPPKE